MPRQAELRAALLRAGPGATLSHQTAAELHGLTGRAGEQVHVTVPVARNPARRGKIPGVIVHRSSRIDLARHPALSPPRTRAEETVLDLVETARDFDEAFAWICRVVGRRRTTVLLERRYVTILVGDTLRDRGWPGSLRPCSPGCPAGKL